MSILLSVAMSEAMSFKEQSSQKLPTHFSRILIDLHSYVQKLNLNRIIDGLQAENTLSLSVSQGLRRIDDIYQKSDIMLDVLHHKEEKDFKLFLKIVGTETIGKFHDATKHFFSHFTEFPGYEAYALWPNGKLTLQYKIAPCAQRTGAWRTTI